MVDDAGGDVGNFNGGWSLTLTSQQPVCNTQTCSIVCPANITVPADSGFSGAVVNYPAAGITGECGVLNYSISSGSFFPLGTTTVNVTGANAAACSFTVTVTGPGIAAGDVIISEFRVRGPSGANDEFIELYNNANSDITVTAATGTGLGVAASDGILRCSIPNGTVMPARGHYLCVNSVAYSLDSYPAGNGTTATGDATYTTDIPDNAGIALFNTNLPANFTLPNRLDAVGSTLEANTLYKEGTGYSALTPFSIDYAFYRDLNNVTGTPKDTNNNATDFLFVDTNGTSAGAGQRLGAPGPENLSGPLQRNSTVKSALIFPCVASSVAPNRVRDFTSDPANNSTFGTLELRRKWTNLTGAAVTRLRYRVVDVTTFPPPSGTADLRARTSTVLVIAAGSNPCGTGAQTLQGTTLEQPPSQPNGGGFNSSLSSGTITLGTPLAAGATIKLRYLLGVQQPGAFRFFINVEALP